MISGGYLDVSGGFLQMGGILKPSQNHGLKKNDTELINLEGLGLSHAIPHFRCSAQDPSLQANVALWSLRLGDLGRGLAVDLPYAIYDIYSMCGNIWHTHTEIIYVYIYINIII